MKAVLKNGSLQPWFVKPSNVFKFLILTLLIGCSSAKINNSTGEAVFSEISPMDGYNPEVATALTNSFENTQGRFSPHGDEIIFLQKRPLVHDYNQAYIKNLKTGQSIRLTVQKAPVENPLLLKNSPWALFSSPFEEWIEHPKLYSQSKAKPTWPQLHPEVKIFEQDIYAMSVHGTSIKRLTAVQGFDGQTSPFPDEKKALYVKPWKGYLQIFELELSKGKSRRITGSPSHKLFPQVSPTGQQIMWIEHQPKVGNLEEKTSLIVSDLRYRNPKTIVETNNGLITPSWHPNGQWILFSTDRNHPANFEIYLIKPDNSCLQRLTYYGGDDIWPSFSPEGSQIIFSSNRTGSYQIYLMNFSPRPTCPAAESSVKSNL